MKKLIVIAMLAVSVFAELPTYSQAWETNVEQFGEAVVSMDDGIRKEFFAEQFKHFKSIDTTGRTDSWFESMFVMVLNAETSIKEN